jgi:disulfide bond formation protein DsbB
MTPLTQTITDTFALLTLLSNIFIIFFIIILVAYLKRIKNNILVLSINFIKNYALLFAFIIATLSTIGSLYYSDIAKFSPCKLCWFQRIFMYPQTFLLGLAFWRNDKKIADYIILLSFIGGLFAAYHYYLQLAPHALLPCSTVGFSVSCSDRFVMHYGYITLPFMALTAFVINLVLMVTSKISK